MRQDRLTGSLRRGGRCLKRQSSGGGVGTILSNVLKKRSCISRTAPRLLCTLEPGNPLPPAGRRRGGCNPVSGLAGAGERRGPGRCLPAGAARRGGRGRRAMRAAGRRGGRGGRAPGAVAGGRHWPEANGRGSPAGAAARFSLPEEPWPRPEARRRRCRPGWAGLGKGSGACEAARAWAAGGGTSGGGSGARLAPGRGPEASAGPAQEQRAAPSPRGSHRSPHPADRGSAPPQLSRLLSPLLPKASPPPSAFVPFARARSLLSLSLLPPGPRPRRFPPASPSHHRAARALRSPLRLATPLQLYLLTPDVPEPPPAARPLSAVGCCLNW